MGQNEERSTLRPLLPETSAESRRPELDDALLRLTERLLSDAEPLQVAETLLDVVTSTYGFPRGAVLVQSEGRLTPLARHATRETAAGSGHSDAVSRALDLGQTQVVAALYPTTEEWLTRHLPPGADLLVLPLRVEERALGALVLQVPAVLRGPQGRRLLKEVERCAGFASLALHRVQRLVQLQRLAATDDLTMIPNRRSFLASLDRELARSVRRGEPVSLVLLDIDEFKQVNDVYGHPAGDEALRNVAAALSIACRDIDSAARYGGEEFVVILPDCDVNACVAIADRLRDAVAAAPAARRLTASAGVATFPTHAGDSEELILAADTALLQAKRSGRDRTVLAAVLPRASRVTGYGRGGRSADKDASDADS